MIEIGRAALTRRTWGLRFGASNLSQLAVVVFQAKLRFSILAFISRNRTGTNMGHPRKTILPPRVADHIEDADLQPNVHRRFSLILAAHARNMINAKTINAM
jgi:hypothetical protein